MSDNCVSVFLAAPDMPGNLLPVILPAFASDPGRFRVVSMTAQWGDVVRDVPGFRADVLVIEADLAPDPDTLRSFLAQLPAGMVAVVVLPPNGGWAERKGQFEAIQTSVRAIFIGPVNWAAVADAVHTAGITERARSAEAAPAQNLYQQAASTGLRSGGMVLGTRKIVFTSFAGGTGKSTLAESVAVELVRNHVKTLLCSFNSPPAAVGHLPLTLHPHAQTWFERPTPDGFQAALQQVKGLKDLDVLLAPNDPLQYEAAGKAPRLAANSIQQLIFAAHSFNYGAILIDLPPFADTEWAVQSILSANVAVIVCRPTIHDQLAAIRAYQLFTQQFLDEHRVPRESVFLVLNMLSAESNLSASEFQAGMQRQLKQVPPILATIPYVGKVPAVQNRAALPTLEAGCEPFAKAARSLTSKLVSGTPLAAEPDEPGERPGLLGRLGITIKVK